MHLLVRLTRLGVIGVWGLIVIPGMFWGGFGETKTTGVS